MLNIKIKRKYNEINTKCTNIEEHKICEKPKSSDKSKTYENSKICKKPKLYYPQEIKFHKKN